MEQLTIPYAGSLLISHLVAYGLAVALDTAGNDVFVGHDPESQLFEPVVTFAGGRESVSEAIRASGVLSQHAIEHDVEPGKTGNNRRSTIWARGSMEGDPERLRRVVELRRELVADVDRAAESIPIALLGGLGAPASWGDEKLKPAFGATALDGVLGNHTSDFVRGVLRPTRNAAATLDRDPFASATGDVPIDKTGWAPPGTRVDYVHQWLAALGIALLPVAHRRLAASVTPACWSSREGGRTADRVTLPLLASPASVPRLRALLGLAALAGPAQPEGQRAHAAGVLRSHGIIEVVEFARRNRAGAGSSVAFDFRRGERIALR